MMLGNTIQGRRLAAGFLAGASGVVALLLFFILLLLVSGFWPLIINIASGVRGNLSFWGTVGQALAESSATCHHLLERALGYSRAGAIRVAAGVCRWHGDADRAPLAALVKPNSDDRPGCYNRFRPPICQPRDAAILAGRAAAADELARQRPGLGCGLADHRNVHRAAGGLCDLGVLAMAQYRWRRWLGVRQDLPEVMAEPTTARGEWVAEQERLHRIKRGAPVARAEVGAATAAQAAPESRLLRTFGILLEHDRIALIRRGLRLMSLIGGEGLCTAKSPARRRCALSQQPASSMVSGMGQSVEVALGSAQQPQEPIKTVELQIAGAREGAPSATLDMRGMQIGNYWLRVNLRSGDNGQVRYTMLQGGGIWAQITAWAIGLAAGAWMTLAALIICDLLGARGWIHTSEV